MEQHRVAIPVSPVQLQSAAVLSRGTAVFSSSSPITGIGAHGHVSFHEPARVQAVPSSGTAEGTYHTW